jgi:hypothetical protein
LSDFLKDCPPGGIPVIDWSGNHRSGEHYTGDTMNLIKSLLVGLVLVSLTSQASADGPRRKPMSRKPTTARSINRTETVNNNESFRQRIDKSTPLKQPGSTSPAGLKPPTSTKPTSGIIAVLIGL